MDASIASQNLSSDPHAFLRSLPKPSKSFVTVETSLCDYFSGCFVENVTVRPSSNEVQAFLKASGIRPINNIVDITNFVLLEQGQPLHAFDADRIKGSLCVRTAREGERLKTLDSSNARILTPITFALFRKKPIFQAIPLIGLSVLSIKPARRRRWCARSNYCAKRARI